jgi:hypothetical protein
VSDQKIDTIYFILNTEDYTVRVQVYSNCNREEYMALCPDENMALCPECGKLFQVNKIFSIV